MAVSTISTPNAPINLGAISGSDRTQAVQNAWSALAVYGRAVIGSFNNSGTWMFLAYKYDNTNQNGMMIAQPYNSNYVFSLQVVNGTKTVRPLALA